MTRKMWCHVIIGILVACGLTNCQKSKQASTIVTFKPGADIQMEVQEEFILAEPETVIQFEAGIFEFTSGLSLDVDRVTLRGRGMDETILSFKHQEAGAEGLYITSDNVLVEDLAIEDTKGHGLKSYAANNIIIRRVRAEWTGGPKKTNGAYGIYPVSSKNVLVEGCIAIGGSDSGIYVGQSQNIIIRNCRAEYNVAGIEIENCYGADAFGNIARHNTGGILVFDLPDIPQQRGHDIRLFGNQVYDNNTLNFAPEGNMVANVPTGTGIMVMANANVEIFDNEIREHGTVNLLVTSYFSSGIAIKDPNYYPFPEAIHIHHNTFGSGGYDPLGDGGELMDLVLGRPIPDIVWDGVVDPQKLVDGDIPAEFRIYIHSNTVLPAKEGRDGEPISRGRTSISFANMGGLATLTDLTKAQVKRDLAYYSGTLPPVEPVAIAGIE